MFFEIDRNSSARRLLLSGGAEVSGTDIGWYGPAKRAFDIVAVWTLAILGSPLLLAIAVVVRLTSLGPVIYTQERVGRGGRVFTMYKFRTMTEGCERETGPVWSTEGDTRVTPPGRFLRMTHLDEAPQLWNILVGDMSLVGPRPERPEISEKLVREIPGYLGRLDVAPGLTGLAQVHLPPDTGLDSVRRKLEMDLEYIRSIGPLIDAQLLACTALFLAGVPFRASCRALYVRNGADPMTPSISTVPTGARPA